MTAIALNTGFAPARTAARPAASLRPVLARAGNFVRGFRADVMIETVTTVLVLGFSSLVVAAFW